MNHLLDSRDSCLKKSRNLLNKCHEIIHDDDYVIMAQIWTSPPLVYFLRRFIVKLLGLGNM